MNKLGIGFGAVAGVGAAVGLYALASMYKHDGSEFKIVMNAGEPQSVTSEGIGVAWGVFDRIHSFPRTKQITSVDDQDVKLRSVDGEEFIGGIRVEYQFTFQAGEGSEERNKELIRRLFRDFSIKDTDLFWDTTQIDPVEKTVKARAQTAAVAIFGTIKTDDYQVEMDNVRDLIKARLQAAMDGENLPIRIVEIDTSGVSPHPDVQERINRIASERRENERAQVTIDNAELVKEAARKEAEATLEFANALRQEGYSEETIVNLNCMRLADRADRFGIPFGVNCVGGDSDGVSVAIDPSNYMPRQDEDSNSGPTGPEF